MGIKRKFTELRAWAADNPACIKAAAAALASVIFAAALYQWDNGRTLETDGSGRPVLERGEAGEDQTMELRVQAGGMEEEIEVTVSGREYTEEELDAAFEDAQAGLQELILGENPGPDEVRTDLELITEVPGTDIGVSWEMDRYDVIDPQGNIIGEDLPEEGTAVNLTAVLTYGDRKQYCGFGVCVYPPEISGGEQLVRDIRKETERADGDTRSEAYMVLPDKAGGEALRWMPGEEKRALGIAVLGLGASCMIFVSDRQKKKEKEKNERRQMQLDYPQIVNKFNLYVRAGMTVRRAWALIVQDYARRNTGKPGRRAYEEMAAAMYRIRGGMPEGECYEDFGVRCREPSYRRFGMLLSQNLRKGSKGLTDILEREAADAFEDRKKLAKKLGEEAGTKLMIPLFMMLAIVFAIVTVPAFFSIQI